MTNPDQPVNIHTSGEDLRERTGPDSPTAVGVVEARAILKAIMFFRKKGQAAAQKKARARLRKADRPLIHAEEKSGCSSK